MILGDLVTALQAKVMTIAGRGRGARANLQALTPMAQRAAVRGGRCWRVGFSRWREAIRRRKHVTEAPAFAEAAFAEAALRVEDAGRSGAGPAARSRRPNAALLDDSPPALPAGSAPRPQPCFLTVTDHSEDPVPLRQMPNSRAGRGRCK